MKIRLLTAIAEQAADKMAPRNSHDWNIYYAGHLAGATATIHAINRYGRHKTAEKAIEDISAMEVFSNEKLDCFINRTIEEAA
jgi:hypothetical protein